ncbi:MAG: 30S ribosomal protein S6 [Eubacterium sp.]|nr:30S ribosomal protein S6 [Eubacterium sp.]
MNKYELALVISTRIDDDAKEAVLAKVKSRIERYGGTITNVDDQGRKRMAYEIQDMKEGFYYFIQFDAPADMPARLEEKLRIQDHVIRFLVVKPDAE